MEKSQHEIKDHVFDLAKKYELENQNCAQCVFAAVTESLGMENKDIFRAATGFADGVGLTGEGQCGAISGGVMAIGYLFGRQRDEFHRRGKMIKALLLSRQLHDRFIAKYGVCRCHELQTKFYGKFYNLLDPAELEAAVKAGVMETCSTLAGDIAKITVQLIQEQQERDAAKAQK